MLETKAELEALMNLMETELFEAFDKGELNKDTLSTRLLTVEKEYIRAVQDVEIAALKMDIKSGLPIVDMRADGLPDGLIALIERNGECDVINSDTKAVNVLKFA